MVTMIPLNSAVEELLERSRWQGHECWKDVVGRLGWQIQVELA
jgi:hypothetical protein